MLETVLQTFLVWFSLIDSTLLQVTLTFEFIVYDLIRIGDHKV
jgi:hypothetical protein